MTLPDFDPVTAVTIFFVYVVIDMLYAWYIIAVNKRQPVIAAMMTSGIYTLAALGVMTYSRNPVYILPLATGAFLGTYLVVKFKK
jgi:hypothetical protein